MKVKDIMKPVQPLHAQATVADAAQVMKDHEVNLVPVGDAERIEGVVTSRDIALATGTGGSGDPGQMPVDELLNNVMGFCYEGEDLASALRTMRACHAPRVLVRDSMARVVGVVSIEDVLVAAPDLEISTNGDGLHGGNGNHDAGSDGTAERKS